MTAIAGVVHEFEGAVKNLAELGTEWRTGRQFVMIEYTVTIARALVTLDCGGDPALRVRVSND